MRSPWFVERGTCPVCDSDRFHKLYECPYDRAPISDYLADFYLPQGMIEPEYLADASYVLCECAKCSAIFQKSIPAGALMERLYEHWIDPEKIFRLVENESNLHYYAGYAQEIMQIIAFIDKMPSSLTFLDYGMGWGRWAAMAQAFGCNSYGTELSTARIEFAKSKGVRCITHEEIVRYEFDFINTEQVFEHIPEPLATLRYLKNVLKPDGIIKISVPPAYDIARRLRVMNWKSSKGSRNSLNAVAPLEHINCFRRKSILAMADATGLREVSIPMTTQWAYTTDWCGPGRSVRNLIRPPYRNLLKRQNYIFLRRCRPDSQRTATVAQTSCTR